MTPLERLKLIQAYHQARQTAQNATGLAKVVALKEARDLLKKLGYEHPQTPKLPELVLPENASRNDLSKAVSKWLKENLQGKTIVAVNGAKIRFNAIQSVKHLTHDGRRGELSAKAITHVIDVFQAGNYLGKENLYKERNDFVAFHTYQKWVEIDGYQLHLEAKAGEKKEGSIETLPELIAYSQNIIEKVALSAFQSVETENSQAGKFKIKATGKDDTAICDKLQADTETSSALLTILQIIDPYGNII